MSLSRAASTLAVCWVLCSLAAPVAAAPAASAVPSHADEIATPTAAAANESDRTPSILAAYPDPSADADAGEYVLVHTGGAANLTLSDGESTVAVPSKPGVVALSARLRLSNAGERLVLRRGGSVVDEAEYGTAPEGDRWNASTGRWTPLGLDLRAPATTGPADATAFVLPDAPDVAVETLRSADDRLLLAGYTFSPDRVADALLAAHRRGVRVRVLVEGSPVGGVSRAQASTLDRLAAAGVPVAVVSGPRAKFSYHHAKYAVVDDRSLVLTENWKPAGTGGRDSRGWGVRVASNRTADELAAVFAADSTGRGVVAWDSFRDGREFVDDAPATQTYRARLAGGGPRDAGSRPYDARQRGRGGDSPDRRRRGANLGRHPPHRPERTVLRRPRPRGAPGRHGATPPLERVVRRGGERGGGRPRRRTPRVRSPSRRESPTRGVGSARSTPRAPSSTANGSSSEASTGTTTPRRRTARWSSN